MGCIWWKSLGFLPVYVRAKQSWFTSGLVSFWQKSPYELNVNLAAQERLIQEEAGSVIMIRCCSCESYLYLSCTVQIILSFCIRVPLQVFFFFFFFFRGQGPPPPPPSFQMECY